MSDPLIEEYVERATRELRAELARLRDEIAYYLLWEPGRAGHAAAHRRLAAAIREGAERS